jgi:hypothetical protein
VVPAVGVCVDDPFGYLRLGEEEPVPPGRGEANVDAIKVFADRQAVEKRDFGDPARMVQGKPKGIKAAPIMPDKRKPLVSEGSHCGEKLASTDSFGMRDMIVGRHGLV